jgi:hypothetical protein
VSDDPGPPSAPTVGTAPPGGGALIRPYLSARVSAGPQPEATGGTDAEPGSLDAPGLRPFLLTGGRTSAEVSIAVETQVVSTDDGRDTLDALTFERRDIVALCEEPLALAEIAAMLGLHLGVVRVLVGDLSTEGLLAVYLPDADVAQDVDTLLRVIRGLRAIS